jgi:anaerobic magnesium-protoporphyrin IX monomethyl ester cyclase
MEIFIAGARVDSADRDLYEKMAKAGVKFISFGIESGNQEILNYYNKKVTLSQVRKAINLSIEMNIITWGNFIFGAPVETREQLQETLEFSLSLPLDMAFYRHLSYQRGSNLWENAVSDHIIDKNDNYKLVGSCNTRSFLTEEEISNFCRKAFKRFYYRPSYLLQEIFRCISRNDFTIIRSLYSAL